MIHFNRKTKRRGNMKKLLLVLMAVLLVGPSYAAQTEKTLVDGVTLTRPSPRTEGNSYIGDSDKIAFFVTYDSSRETAAVTANVTVSVSLDGKNWQDISWFDAAGGVTPQTSETLSTDGTYYGWFDRAITAPRIRIGIDMTEANAPGAVGYGTGDTATVTITLIEKK
jgi:hypothetical protein